MDARISKRKAGRDLPSGKQKRVIPRRNNARYAGRLVKSVVESVIIHGIRLGRQKLNIVCEEMEVCSGARHINVQSIADRFARIESLELCQFLLSLQNFIANRS